MPGFAGEFLADQVIAVLDRHDVDRFVVWGYSKGGAMSLCIARATGRAVGVVCGGFAPKPVRPATLRQLDRRLRPEHPSRSLWWWYNGFDWAEEVRTMSCARLFYWGSEDRQMASALRAIREQLPFNDADFVEFPGLDHSSCNAPETLRTTVVPGVANWLSAR